MECCDSKDVKSDDLKGIVRDKYGKIASAGSMDCGCGCSSDPADKFSVIKDDYTGIEGYVPEADLNLGCGIPTAYADIKSGDTVVDLGSGAGNDCFVARQMVGEKGRVIGIDMTPEMIQRAKANVDKLGFANVTFHLGEIENLPLASNMADVVISNCVINLVPDKTRAFLEIYRVLKPGGHFCISDVVSEGTIPPELVAQAELYAGCISGALPVEKYLEIIRQTGFSSVEIKKKKYNELPDDLLNELLNPDQVNAFKKSVAGFYSITVTGVKPTCSCGCS
ncbi:MAG: arsenite methyltransferase [Bacteroidota bacterium]